MTQTQDKESMAKDAFKIMARSVLEDQAGDALEMVRRHGIDSPLVNRDALQCGLEDGLFDQPAILNQSDVDEAQVQYQQREARSALDKVTRHGVNGSPVDRDALRYGLEKWLFTQFDVDEAQVHILYQQI